MIYILQYIVFFPCWLQPLLNNIHFALDAIYTVYNTLQTKYIHNCSSVLYEKTHCNVKVQTFFVPLSIILWSEQFRYQLDKRFLSNMYFLHFLSFIAVLISHSLSLSPLSFSRFPLAFSLSFPSFLYTSLRSLYIFPLSLSLSFLHAFHYLVSFSRFPPLYTLSFNSFVSISRFTLSFLFLLHSLFPALHPSSYIPSFWKFKIFAITVITGVWLSYYPVRSQLSKWKVDEMQSLSDAEMWGIGD